MRFRVVGAAFAALVVSVFAVDASAHPVLTFDTGKAPPVRVTLGHQYFLSDDGGTRRIFDFERTRVYELQLAEKTYREFSLYSVLGFSVLELQNRLRINRVLTDAKLKGGESHAPAIQEQLFSLTVDGENTVVDSAHVKNSTTFTWKGKELVSVSDKVTALPAGYQTEYWRWLRYTYGGHPLVYSQLASRTGVPESVRILRPEGSPAQTVTLRLTDISVQPDTPYSLAGFTRAKPSREPYIALEQLGSGDRSTAFSSRAEAAKKDRDAATAAGKILDAALAHFAYALSMGDADNDWFVQTRDQMAADEDARTLVTALQASNADQASAAVRALQTLRTKNKSPHAYLLDVFAANHEVALKRPEEAERLFIAALSQNPYLTGAWFDLGKVYYGTFRVPEAWSCWDAARSLNPNHPFAKEINTLEQDLRADHPDFF